MTLDVENCSRKKRRLLTLFTCQVTWIPNSLQLWLHASVHEESHGLVAFVAFLRNIRSGFELKLMDSAEKKLWKTCEDISVFGKSSAKWLLLKVATMWCHSPSKTFLSERRGGHHAVNPGGNPLLVLWKLCGSSMACSDLFCGNLGMFSLTDVDGGYSSFVAFFDGFLRQPSAWLSLGTSWGYKSDHLRDLFNLPIYQEVVDKYSPNVQM